LNVSIKSKYNFSDISVLYRTENGYINLSDFDLNYYKQEMEYMFPMKARFILAICLFGRKFLYTEIDDVSELLILAGIGNEKFIAQVGTGLSPEIKEQILAQICAGKITNYSLGTVKQSQDVMTFDFCRLKYVKENGKSVKTFPSVLRKKFNIASKV